MRLFFGSIQRNLCFRRLVFDRFKIESFFKAQILPCREIDRKRLDPEGHFLGARRTFFRRNMLRLPCECLKLLKRQDDKRLATGDIRNDDWSSRPACSFQNALK
jgi:hypothetical protein